jgi:hypothetical protein
MRRLALVLLLISGFLISEYAIAQTSVNGRKDGFNCVVTVATATTLTAACSSIAANRAMYVTDVEFGSSAAGGTAADSFPTLKYGTGTACATGTVVFWQAMVTANGNIVATLSTPIKIPKGNDICWIMSTAGSKTIQIHGFYGETE